MRYLLLSVRGFGKVVDDTSKSDRDLPAEAGGATVIASHDRGFLSNAAGGEPVPLNLPIEEIPEIRPPPGAVWTDGGSDQGSRRGVVDRCAVSHRLISVTAGRIVAGFHA